MKITTDGLRPGRAPLSHWRARVQHLALALGAGLVLLAATPLTRAAASDAAADCPPVPQAPSPEQVQAAQAGARDRGYLWRIRKDGHDSFLFGTIHVGKLAWAFQGPVVNGALRAADTVALELDITDPATLQALAQHVQRAPAAAGASAPADGADGLTLPSAMRARMRRLQTAACLPDAQFDAMDPLMQAMTLMVMAGRRDGLDPGFAQEVILAGAARVQHKPIVALETPELQWRTLAGDRPADGLAAIDQMLTQLEHHQARPILRRMATAWEQGDLRTMESYPDWCQCLGTEADRRLQARLNDARNPGLAQRIDALHSSGRRVFVAVGALHMTGRQGLPRLLAARGYSVARVPFSP